MQRVNNENLRYFDVHTAAICFTSDSSFTSAHKNVAHKNNKKREAALKKEAGGDENRGIFLLGLIDYAYYAKHMIIIITEYYRLSHDVVTLGCKSRHRRDWKTYARQDKGARPRYPASPYPDLRRFRARPQHRTLSALGRGKVY